MGASQYLRPENLVDSVKSYLSPEVVRGASSFLGESEPATSHAMHSAVPGLLSGMLNMSSTSSGANSLVGMIRDGGFGSLLGNPASLFAGGGQTSKMLSTGQSLAGRILGTKASSVTNAIASSSGVKPSSAGTLMSLLAPLTLGVLGKTVGSQGLNAGGISNLLSGQKKEIADATPLEVSHILGLGGEPVPAPVSTRVYEEREEAPHASALYEERAVPRQRSWLPLLLIGLAAVGLLAWWLSRRPAQRASVEPPVAATPAPVATPNPADTTEPVPATRAVTGTTTLNFVTGSTQLTPESTRAVNDLAATLKTDPNAQIQVAGHTDNTGNAQANQQLSLSRANAVKAMLVRDGISADRISTAGYGQDRASNDTEEGRLQNRRTELTVTNR